MRTNEVSAREILEWIDVNVHPNGDECGCNWCLIYWNIVKIEMSIRQERDMSQCSWCGDEMKAGIWETHTCVEDKEDSNLPALS